MSISDDFSQAEFAAKHIASKSPIKPAVAIVLGSGLGGFADEMTGAVRVGYNDKPPPVPEWNIKCDIKAAQVVFSSGVPLVVAPLDGTTSLKLEDPLRRRL